VEVGRGSTLFRKTYRVQGRYSYDHVRGTSISKFPVSRLHASGDQESATRKVKSFRASRMSSGSASSAVTLRSLTNGGADFLLTTFPAPMSRRRHRPASSSLISPTEQDTAPVQFSSAPTLAAVDVNFIGDDDRLSTSDEVSKARPTKTLHGATVVPTAFFAFSLDNCPLTPRRRVLAKQSPNQVE